MNRLKELRKGKNLTQDDLAELLEVTKLTISDWESGKHEIKADKIKTLCKTFGVDAPYLLGYSEFKNEADIKAAAQLLLGGQHGAGREVSPKNLFPQSGGQKLIFERHRAHLADLYGMSCSQYSRFVIS